MNATAATAQYAPAQVGKGRTAHKADAEHVGADTLCERTVSRVLTPAEAAKMKDCVACNRIAEERAAAPAEQVEETPAAEMEAPEIEETEEPAVDVEEVAQVLVAEEAEKVEGAEGAPAPRPAIAAYTAAAEQLYLNGQDDEDRTLRMEEGGILETLPTLRRKPRWNPATQRFTVNKVALILVSDATGERVWVRGEGDPVRVDATGTPTDPDAPAGPGPVDVRAVLAATRLLRRRREVQRVIDNREAARAWSSTPKADEAPAAAEEAPTPTPAPVEEPAPAVAPVVEEAEASAAVPEWRTLKGVDAPFLLYGEDTGEEFRPASDRKQCAGEPLLITRTWMSGGTRYAEDATGRKCHLWGAATKYWVAPTA